MCECSGKCVTEREAVERERRAFRAGVGWHFYRASPEALVEGDIVGQIRTRYPLPKVRRLREWRCSGLRYRYNPDRGLFEMAFGSAWSAETDANLRAAFILEHITPLADLKANPYEEVDA